jgi:hypothetical protein
MWTSGLPGQDDEDPAEFIRRSQAPDNEIPVAVPLNRVLARTDDVAVAWTGTAVYSTGVAFTLLATTRRSDQRLNDVFWSNAGAPDGLLVGVEFADGRWATNRGEVSEPGLVLQSGGGSGGDRTCEQTMWLHPVPPAGPLTLVVRAPSLGIEETRTVFDATPLTEAVAAVTELWPWTPPDPDRYARKPAGPAVPADSWFARARQAGDQ